MKRLISGFFFFLISCSAAKNDAREDVSAVHAYLGQTLYNKNYDSVIVISQPLSNKKLIAIYETAYLERTLDRDDLHKIVVQPGLEHWPFNSEEINAIKSRIQKDGSANWTSKDFGGKNVVIKNADVLKDTEFLNRHISGNSVILQLSHPIYTGDKQSTIFRCIISGIGPSGSLAGSGVIIMNKEGQGWKLGSVLNREAYD